MPTFSFDIESTYDKAEINNVFQQAQREIANRYDFKNTPAGIEWLGDKAGFVITGNSEMQLTAITDIVRRGLINRGQSTKTLDLSKEPTTSNLQMKLEVPFVAGLDQDKAKKVTTVIREVAAKAKPQIQGDIVRVSSTSKDELQTIMSALKTYEFDFPLVFTNFR